jgi:hypothetical protein
MIVDEREQGAGATSNMSERTAGGRILRQKKESHARVLV